MQFPLSSSTPSDSTTSSFASIANPSAISSWILGVAESITLLHNYIFGFIAIKDSDELKTTLQLSKETVAMEVLARIDALNLEKDYEFWYTLV